MIIYMDGPEKSGKSYLAKIVGDKFGARIRHWGPVDPDDRVYLDPLTSDVLSDELTIWDRGWAAEHTYARLLGRDRRLRDDPWLGEWLYGRVVQTVGVRIMLLGPDATTLKDLRDEDDLPVEPLDEVRAFKQYAERFGYHVFLNPHSEDAADSIAVDIHYHARETYKHGARVRPPAYCGPPRAPVVVVGQERNERSKFPGAWAPFTTPLTTKMGRLFEDDAFKVGWTNAEAIPPQALAFKTILACGEKAQKWVKYHVPNPEAVVNLAHPAYAFRYNSKKANVAKDRIIKTIEEVRTLL